MKLMAGEMSERPLHGWYLPVKAFIDFTAGVLLLALFTPVIVLAAGLVKLTSRGPAFYRQTRVGKHGRHFQIIKLRSMRQDAEVGTGAVWCAAEDDRITPLGKILRATHLDELPQLINVVKGEMSLVGPRPERPEFVRNFEMLIEGYAARSLVRPGITGIAQLRLPPDTDLNSVKQKLHFDLYYVRHISLWLDLLSIAFTGLNFQISLLRALVPAALRIPTQDVVRADSQSGRRERTESVTIPVPVRRESPTAETATSRVVSMT